MNEIKLSLSIELQGSTMLSKEECLKTAQETITTKSGKKRTITKVVEDWSKMEKHTMKLANPKNNNSKFTTFYTRKCRPATQSLNMNKEAYEYMISEYSCPSWLKPNKWATMSKKERLEAHLQRTVEHLGGTSYTYQVFEG